MIIISVCVCACNTQCDWREHSWPLPVSGLQRWNSVAWVWVKHFICWAILSASRERVCMCVCQPVCLHMCMCNPVCVYLCVGGRMCTWHCICGCVCTCVCLEIDIEYAELLMNPKLCNSGQSSQPAWVENPLSLPLCLDYRLCQHGFPMPLHVCNKCFLHWATIVPASYSMHSFKYLIFIFI